MSISARIAGALTTNSRLFRAPGRVNIIGEHTDYNDGFVLPTNSALYTWLTIRPRMDRTIEVVAHNLDDKQSFSLDDIRRSEVPGWLDYLKGVAAELETSGIRLRGAEISIDGEIPIGGGLSSSASLELAAAAAMLEISGSTLARSEIAQICCRAERKYARVNCGIMDQYSIACCRRGEAILLDCRSLATEPVKLPEQMTLLVTDSTVKHTLPGSGYNNRASECREAAGLLARIEPGINALRDLSLEVLEKHRDRLGDRLYRRARHVVSEIQRTKDAFEALKSCDPDWLGQLVSASHASLRDDFEVSCDEIESLVAISDQCDGVLGSRMVGAGFGGCVLSVVRSGLLDETIEHITGKYGEVIGRKPWVHIVSPTDPVQEVSGQ